MQVFHWHAVPHSCKCNHFAEECEDHVKMLLFTPMTNRVKSIYRPSLTLSTTEQRFIQGWYPRFRISGATCKRDELKGQWGKQKSFLKCFKCLLPCVSGSQLLQLLSSTCSGWFKIRSQQQLWFLGVFWYAETARGTAGADASQEPSVSNFQAPSSLHLQARSRNHLRALQSIREVVSYLIL